MRVVFPHFLTSPPPYRYSTGITLTPTASAAPTFPVPSAAHISTTAPTAVVHGYRWSYSYCTQLPDRGIWGLCGIRQIITSRNSHSSCRSGSFHSSCSSCNSNSYRTSYRIIPIKGTPPNKRTPYSLNKSIIVRFRKK